MSIRRQTLYDDAGNPVVIVIPIAAESTSRDTGSDVKRKIVNLSLFHGVIKREGRDGLSIQEEMRREWDRDDSR